MNTNSDNSRFSIYRQSTTDKKRYDEACGILHLLERLNEFVKFEDVQFGQDPPDFIFHHEGKKIGVELTDLNPKVFEVGGNQLRGKFDEWQTNIEPDSIPHEFDWGSSTLRESLAAFQERLLKKREQANRWCLSFSERWLLMRIADGSPFGEILANKSDMKLETEPGMEAQVADYFAKAIYGIYAICQDIEPFDCVLLFRKTNLATSICNVLTFSANPTNSYGLPELSNEILKRGEVASDSFLDWKIRRTKSIKSWSVKLGDGHITGL